jgi:YD repeat-containing protein
MKIKAISVLMLCLILTTFSCFGSPNKTGTSVETLTQKRVGVLFYEYHPQGLLLTKATLITPFRSVEELESTLGGKKLIETKWIHFRDYRSSSLSVDFFYYKNGQSVKKLTVKEFNENTFNLLICLDGFDLSKYLLQQNCSITKSGDYQYCDHMKLIEPDLSEPCTNQFSIEELADFECTYYNYNSEGREIAQWRNISCREGYGYKYCTRFAYDDQGHQISESMQFNCYGTDPAAWGQYADYSVHREYDEAGRIIIEKQSNNLCHRYTYDAAGKLARDDFYKICDGIRTKHTEFLYDIHGHLILEKTIYPESLDDSGKMYCRSKSYDDSGNLDSEYSDNDCDGTPNEMCTSYKYNEEKIITERSWDRDCNGKYTEVHQYNYDENGRLVLEYYIETVQL